MGRVFGYLAGSVCGAMVFGLLGTVSVGLVMHQRDQGDSMGVLAAYLYGAPVGAAIGLVCGALIVRLAIKRSMPRPDPFEEG